MSRAHGSWVRRSLPGGLVVGWRRLLAAAVGCLAATALAVPAEAGTQGWPEGKSRLQTKGMLLGSVEYERGNRHQVHLTSTSDEVSGFIRSWYCPSGVTVTPDWVSSRCTHRGTMRVVGPASERFHRVSSTGLSGRQWGYVGVDTDVGEMVYGLEYYRRADGSTKVYGRIFRNADLAEEKWYTPVESSLTTWR